MEQSFCACPPAEPPEALGLIVFGKKQPVCVGWSRPGKQPPLPACGQASTHPAVQASVLSDLPT